MSHMSQVIKVKKPKRFILSKKPRIRGDHAFAFLNVAQFLSALNDNLFKFLSIYLLIDLQGSAASNSILFWVGIAFVLPFLLFSTAAGVLADKFSKQRVIVWLKGLEVVIIAVSFFVYYYKIPFGCYALVFVLCLQNALMGPSKYSIIPELVGEEKIAKANGVITSFTYLACIFGTVLASFVTQVTDKNFMVGAGVCMVIAVVGFIASLFIPYTEPKRSKNKISPFFLSQVVKTFKYCRRTPKLRLAVMGSAFFLFIGAFLQLNIIPFAINFLGLTDVSGGYLFSGCAIGIALGAVVAGRLCRKELDLGLSCFALLLLGAFLFAVPFFASKLIPVAIAMVSIGFFGGMFVIPLDSYIQAFSPSEMRGQVVALASFLSFVGVLLAPLCLMLFGNVFCVSSATGFLIMACIVFITFIILTKYLCSNFLNYLSRVFLQPFFDLHFIDYPFSPKHQEDRVALIFRKTSIKHLLLLAGESSKFHLFIVRRERSLFDFILNHFSTIDILYSESEIPPNPSEIKAKIGALNPSVKPIFLFTNARSYRTFAKNSYFTILQRDHHYALKYFKIRNTARFKPHWKQPLKRTHLTYHFVAPTPLIRAPARARASLREVKTP